MITMLRNDINFVFLSILTDFDSVIILLIVEALNESAIIMIELAVLEFTMKEQFIIN